MIEIVEYRIDEREREDGQRRDRGEAVTAWALDPWRSADASFVAVGVSCAETHLRVPSPIRPRAWVMPASGPHLMPVMAAIVVRRAFESVWLGHVVVYSTDADRRVLFAHLREVEGPLSLLVWLARLMQRRSAGLSKSS